MRVRACAAAWPRQCVEAMALALQLCSATLASAASGPPPSWLEPTYHFRRAAYHMNDPNVRGCLSFHIQLESCVAMELDMDGLCSRIAVGRV